jgi:hypothetical protein
VEAFKNCFFCRKSTFRGKWKTNEFKLVVRIPLKNCFIKKLKRAKNENLVKKNALVAKAQELQESSDLQPPI